MNFDELMIGNNGGVVLSYPGGENSNYGVVTILCNPNATNITNIQFNSTVHSPDSSRQPSPLFLVNIKILFQVGGLNSVSFESAVACSTGINSNPCSIPINSSTGEVYNISGLIGGLYSIHCNLLFVSFFLIGFLFAQYSISGKNATNGDNFTLSVCTDTVGYQLLPFSFIAIDFTWVC